MSAGAVMVWIVERNHEPLIRDGRVVSFSCGVEGTMAMKDYLNTFPISSADSENYYDAVLYKRASQRKG